MPTFKVGMKVVDKQCDRYGVGVVKEILSETPTWQILVEYDKLKNMEPSPMPIVLYEWQEAVDNLVVIETPKV